MQFLLSEIFGPLARRLGTMAGASLLTVGATQGLAEQASLVVTGVALLGVDLVTSHAARVARRRGAR